mgnify:CR=1 FL=1
MSHHQFICFAFDPKKNQFICFEPCGTTSEARGQIRINKSNNADKGTKLEIKNQQLRGLKP